MKTSRLIYLRPSLQLTSELLMVLLVCIWSVFFAALRSFPKVRPSHERICEHMVCLLRRPSHERICEHMVCHSTAITIFHFYTHPFSCIRVMECRNASLSNRKFLETLTMAEQAFLKQQPVFLWSKKSGKGKRTGKGGNRFWKSIGLGFKTPRDAIEDAGLYRIRSRNGPWWFLHQDTQESHQVAVRRKPMLRSIWNTRPLSFVLGFVVFTAGLLSVHFFRWHSLYIYGLDRLVMLLAGKLNGSCSYRVCLSTAGENFN